MISLFALNISKDDAFKLRRLLNIKEFYVPMHKKERTQSLIAYAFVSYIVCKERGEFSNRFLFDEYGKPYLANYKDVFFNFSHTDGLIVCGLSSTPIGVDVEMVKPRGIEAIGKRFFAKGEYNKLICIDSRRERLEYFYDIWTIKESYVKFLGIGISHKLSSFEVIYDDTNISVNEDLKCNFKMFKFEGKYKISVCSELNLENLHLSVVDAGKLCEFYSI